MLDIKFIKENREIVEMAIKNKKVKADINLDTLFSLADEKRQLQQQLDELNAERNLAAKAQDHEKGKALKMQASEIETSLSEKNKAFLKIMLLIPNIPSVDTPIGNDESDNTVIREWGDKPEFLFTPKPHWELGEELGVIDKEKAADISGARFGYIKGDLALMQFAIIQFAFATLTNEETLKVIASEANLDVNTKPFTPVVPPAMIRPEVLNRMGRLEPREDRYHLEEDNLYLAGSAEHALGPLHMDSIIPEEEMPIRYLGYSTSFRREAGTYGKDTKGILRMHQFDKLEMETFCVPEDSRSEQDFLVAIQEYMLRRLKIPHQVISICTGDMGIPDHRQIDIDSWMPGQDTYRETHTSDLMTSFQSRRLNTKVKRADNKKEFVHMNDATLFAIGRMLIAIMENYQQEDGTILVPQVLQQYMGGKMKIEK